MTRNVAKTLLALGFVGAIAAGTATPTLAQGFYLDGPGVHIGVGHPWYRHHYYYGPYAYYGPHHRYWRYHDWDRD